MNIWDKIYNYTIFNGLDKNEIKALTFCFKSKVRKYEKNEVIVNKGERFDNIVLIISGQAKVVNYMQNGNVNMNSKLNVGDIFGAIELFSNSGQYLSNVIASKKTEAILFNKYIVNSVCENNCFRHKKFLQNLTSLVAQEYIKKQQIIDILSARSTKEKVLLLLKSFAKEQNVKYIEIPLSRQEMADFLAVDRSALSLTLSKMKKDGIIDFEKNHFVIKS